MSGIGQALVGWLAEERDRWVLWLPVLLAAGIAVYFALPVEPPGWLGAAGLAVSAAGLASRRMPLVMAAAASFSLGFTLAGARTMLVAQPMLADRVGPASVTGRVVYLGVLPGGGRVTLDRPRVSGLDPAHTPETVRLRLRGGQPEVAPGDWVRVRAILTPPPAPSLPGGFDFQRQAYFDGPGAVGFALGRLTVVSRKDVRGFEALVFSLAELRQSLTARIRDGIGGTEGAVAAAIMTGERGAIPEEVIESFRDSGLAHLLAISGINIGLAAGILYVSLRALLALVPGVAVRWPIKKWAAAVAIFGAFGYTMLSGAGVPSVRSFLMLALVLIAVLLDRRGISMRLAAWAAAAILAIEPETLLGASFQLSFAAVVALVAVYEEVNRRRLRGGGEATTGWARVGSYFAGVALTTLVASAATMPFSIYHFNRIALYGLAANMVAVPITALWIMPWAVLVFLLMPFGLEGLALLPLGWGVGATIDVSRTVAAWPGASIAVHAIPATGIALVTLGGLWLCLWRRRWRFWGIALMVAGLATGAGVRPPDVLVDGEGRLLAVRTAAGGLAPSSLSTARFARETWLRHDGQETPEYRWPDSGTSPDGRLSCDALGCIYRIHGHAVALVRQADALFEDCRVADVVVSTVPVRRCPSATRVVDRFDLWREGAHALWLDEGGVRIASVNGERGHRPWVIRPEPARRDSH